MPKFIRINDNIFNTSKIENISICTITSENQSEKETYAVIVQMRRHEVSLPFKTMEEVIDAFEAICGVLDFEVSETGSKSVRTY